MKGLIYGVFLVLLVFFVASVNAEGVIVSVGKEQVSVAAGGEAVFTLSIKNTDIRDQIFQLKIDDFALVTFDGIIEKASFDPSGTVTIPAKQTRDVKAKLKISEKAQVDRNYITNIKVKSLTNPAIGTSAGLSVYVISPRELITIDADIPDVIVPGRAEKIPITLINNGYEDLVGLDLFYTSSVFSLEDKVSLNSKQKKTVDLNLVLDSILESGEYTLTVRLFDEGKLKGSKSFKINVGENPDLKETEEVIRGFLRSVVVITRENEGNIPVTKTVRYPVGVLESWFINTKPEGGLKTEDGKKYFEWTFDIPPGDITRIEVTKDYRLLFFVIVAILLLIGVVLHFRKKNLKIRKTIFTVRRDKEAGVSEFKILLHVRNVTPNEMYNVKVIDLLPRFVKPEMDFGTLKPAKVQEGSRGMRLVWNIDKVDPGDERVITYKVRSKLSLLGKLVLPPAVVQYYGKKKQVVNVRSNRLIFRW